MEQYIKKENLKNITLIGHSMGGNLAIDIIAEFPSRVSGLILVESIPCMRELMMPGVPASILQYNSPYNISMIEMADDDFKTMVMGMSQMMTNLPAKAEMLTNWAVMADRKVYVYGYTDLLKLDLREKLSTINIPSLIVGASFPDKETIQINYEKQYANTKNKEIIIVEDSRHFIMFDQPQHLSELINNYLKKNVK
ncbi:MAG: alpha/beta hydrolase [Ginsengibacter sp.]